MKNSQPVIDAHVHIFPPAMMARKEHLMARDQWFAEAFGHPKAKMRSAEELIASMDKADISISIVVGWPWQQDMHLVEHNAYLAESVSRFPDRLRWLGIFNPHSPAARQIISDAALAGASGFGELNADGQGFSWSEPDQYMHALELVAELGLPLMAHTSEPVGHIYPGKGRATPHEVLTAIDTVPRLEWVLAHWGGGLPFYELMPEVKLACERVSYDSAASSFLYSPDVFRNVINIVGAEKVLFGSDWPVLGQGKLLERIRSLDLPEDTLAAVVGNNAARIYRVF